MKQVKAYMSGPADEVWRAYMSGPADETWSLPMPDDSQVMDATALMAEAEARSILAETEPWPTDWLVVGGDGLVVDLNRRQLHTPFSALAESLAAFVALEIS